MKARAAVAWPGATNWAIDEVDVDPPGPHEVLVRMEAAGLCHSDAHLMAGGYEHLRRPIIGGHEGAGVVELAGPGVDLQPGDHVVFAFLPSCGVCASCIAGRPHLCEVGAYLGEGFAVTDHAARYHSNGSDLGSFCFLGTFASHVVVHERSAVRVDPGLPLPQLCTLGCAGVTGWGASVNAGGVGVGDVTVVVGIGGIGAMALFGARAAGAELVVAIDRFETKQQQAKALGADVTYASMAEAVDELRDLTHGAMADQVVLCISVGDGRLMADAMALLGKQGRAVIVNVHPASDTTPNLSLRDVQSYEKQIVGCLGGTWSPRRGINELARRYARGQLPLEQIVSREYALDDLALGFADQEAGRNVRGVVTRFG